MGTLNVPIHMYIYNMYLYVYTYTTVCMSSMAISDKLALNAGLMLQFGEHSQS